MLRRPREGSSVTVERVFVEPVNERAPVRAAAQQLADATAHLGQAEQELADAVRVLGAVERQAGAEWRAGAGLPAALTAAQLQRSTAEIAARVARRAVEAARGDHQLLLARAREGVPA